MANPPFGVDWKRQKDKIEHEHEKLGYAGRFGAGLPRVNDGTLLFLQHMIDKFEQLNPEKDEVNKSGEKTVFGRISKICGKNTMMNLSEIPLVGITGQPKHQLRGKNESI